MKGHCMKLTGQKKGTQESNVKELMIEMKIW